MIVSPANPIMQFVSDPSVKFYSTVIGALWTAFKCVHWVRDIREKDLKGIKEDVNTVSTEVRSQTGVIESGFGRLTNSVQELRGDFRTFYTSPDPLMVPVNSRPTRKRKSVSVRAKAKKRAAVKKQK